MATGRVPTTANSPLTAKGDLFGYSTTQARVAVGNDGETLVADSSTATGLRYQGNYAAGKNLINNGDMTIAQRGTSTSNVTTTGFYACDRFQNTITSMGTYTVSQESDGPAGFGKSFKTLVTTADSAPAASSRTVIIQRQEGLALQRLAFGTASAKTTTMSFYVKSNVTGTYIFEIATGPGRHICASYTINTADTWEKKTITFVGDTAVAITADTNSGMAYIWWLGAGTDFTSGTLQTSSWAALTNANRAVGQVNFAAAINNYFQITGVQWEIGNVATDFQLSAGTIQGELAACQRYYYRITNPNSSSDAMMPTGFAIATTQANMWFNASVSMRVTPTSVESANIRFFDGVSAFTPTISLSAGSEKIFGIAGVTSGLTQFRPYYAIAATAANASYIGWSAEL
jgi:hypothetical protein